MLSQRLSRLLLVGLLASLVAAPARADVPYKAEIKLEGLDDAKLLDTLKAASQLVQLEDKLPPSNAALRRRAEDDLPRLKEVMQAAGYWTPTLSYALDLWAEPAKVTVTIDPGPLFHLASVTFRTQAGETPPLLDKLGAGGVGLEIGGPAATAPDRAPAPRHLAPECRQPPPLAQGR